MLDERRDQYTFSLQQKVFLSLYGDSAASLFGLEIVAERIALGTGSVFLYPVVSYGIKSKRFADRCISKINRHCSHLFQNVILFSLTYYTILCLSII